MSYLYLFLGLSMVSVTYCAADEGKADEEKDDIAIMLEMLKTAEIGEKVAQVFVDRFDRPEHKFNQKTPIDTLVAVCQNKTKNEWQYGQLCRVIGTFAAVRTAKSSGHIRAIDELRNLLPNALAIDNKEIEKK